MFPRVVDYLLAFSIALVYRALGQSCTSVSDETFSSAFDLSSSDSTPLVVNNNANKMNVYPSMSFSCSGVITGVRAALPSRNDKPASAIQEIFFAMALFRDSAVVDVIVLRTVNMSQTAGTIVWSTNVPLNVPVERSDYIGLSIPRDRNVSGRAIYYQGIAAAGGNTLGRQYALTYRNLTELDARIREVTVGIDVPVLLSQPYLQITVVPDQSSQPSPPLPASTEVPPSPSTEVPPSPTPSATPPVPPSAISQEVLIGLATVGGVLFVLIAMVIIILPIVLCVACPRRGRYDSEKEFGVRMEPDRRPQRTAGGFDNPHVASPTSVSSERRTSPVGVTTPHSPTTGQLRPHLSTEVVYALPEQKTGNYERDPSYSYARKLFAVPTLDERSHYSSNVVSDGCYELPEIKPKQVGSDAYEYPSTESQHYWCPAEDEAELYRQLSRNKFQEVLRQSVREEGKIGEGEFGTVYKGEWLQWNGCVKEVAIKRLHDNQVKVQFLREAAVMGQFNHQHVARLFGVVTVGNPVMIMMELLPEGDLHSYLQSLDSSPTRRGSELANRLLRFTREICCGMVHLSSKRFIHRDLATRNVLLDGNLTCKIADFGMSRDVANDYYLSKGGRIPLKWTSPEGILYHKYYPGSDVWSYGMVTYEVWSLGHKPYEAMEAAKVVQMLSSGRGHCQPPPPGCPREIYAVMVKCWNWDHSKRPAFEQIEGLLDKDDSMLTSVSDNSDLVPADGLVLGSSLRSAHFLHMDLQKTYDSAT